MDKVLIDTSVWVAFFRGKEKTIVDQVSSLLTKGRVVIAGLVLTELLQGALNDKELAKIVTLLEPVERIDPSSDLWEEAGRLSYSMRRKGLTIATLDVLLAALAIENDCLVFTLDKHFTLIAKHSDLRIYS
ncbi:MAG: PIN domain-containing protein [Deltaproteobacteria bacterium]|nr:PIN domain-containing protein [Deltaproteobacteria bacterium]